MLRHPRSPHHAPVWLFSFVDLAFLLLIVFTQIGPDVDARSIEIGQIEVPRINSPAAPVQDGQAGPAWQLRVYPMAPSEDSEDTDAARSPFLLVEPNQLAAADSEQRSDGRVDAAELAAHLRLLHDRRIGKPVLAPHRDSRSEDLLVAVGLLEEVWLGDRSVTVIPGHPVAAGNAARRSEAR